jgi:hypothetical protein
MVLALLGARWCSAAPSDVVNRTSTDSSRVSRCDAGAGAASLRSSLRAFSAVVPCRLFCCVVCFDSFVSGLFGTPVIAEALSCLSQAALSSTCGTTTLRLFA